MCRLRYFLFIFIFAFGLMPYEIFAQEKVVATIDAASTGQPITILIFGGPPAKMNEQSLSEAPRIVSVPAASITVYEFAVK